jgi:hypothetical protein
MADWYYTANGQQAGPVELQALRQMLDAGSVSRGELVYGPGLTQWTPAGHVPALSAGIPGADAPGGSQTQPLAAAAALIGYRGMETGTTGLSALAMEALRRTKPWVRFISIMTFIGAGFMLLAGISMLIVGAVAGNRSGGAVPGWLGGVYLAMAAIYVIPAVLLTRYANGIASLMRTQRMSDVEQALNAQKSFWKFSGIMIIVVMCAYAVGIAGLVIFKMRF